MSIIFKHSKELIDYNDALKKMDDYVLDIHQNDAAEIVWLLEHPDIYTSGVSGDANDLLNKDIELIKTGRGGQITYHGPGMRIAYIMLNLNKRDARDIKKYISNLQLWLINSLKEVGVNALTLPDHIGVWVSDAKDSSKLDKIAAIGVRVRKWISFHGIALNVNPDLDKFNSIVPCGISDKKLGVTSLKKLGVDVDSFKFDKILEKEFRKIFDD